MSRITKWTLPVVAFGLMVALSGARAVADYHEKGEKVKVSGVVLKEDGSPAADARVRVVPATPMKKDKGEGAAEKPAPQQADGEKPKGPKVPPVAETTTDAQGKFTVELPPGKYRVNANLKGSGNASKTITVEAGKTPESVELKLKPQAKKGGDGAAPVAPKE